MKLVGIAFALIACNAFAAGKKSYDLKLDLTQNGVKYISPSVVVKNGETTTIIEKVGDEERFIDVSVDEDSGLGLDALKIKMAVGKIDEFGGRTILARPEVMVEENMAAKFTVEDNASTEKMSLSVLASEKKL